jgi:hypothetical protein
MILFAVLTMIFGICAKMSIAADDDFKAITFINNNPGDTVIGLARFLDWDERSQQFQDYEILNQRFDGKNTVVYLTPGTYCATQFWAFANSIIAYEIFYIKVIDQDFTVEFPYRELKLIP